MNYYPLAEQNEWQYKQNDGHVYVNRITASNKNEFTMHNSAVNTKSTVKTDGNILFTDALEAGHFNQWLKNDLRQGECWDVHFKASAPAHEHFYKSWGNIEKL